MSQYKFFLHLLEGAYFQGLSIAALEEYFRFFLLEGQNKSRRTSFDSAAFISCLLRQLIIKFSDIDIECGHNFEDRLPNIIPLG
jgi:hypothetical protein